MKLYSRCKMVFWARKETGGQSCERSYAEQEDLGFLTWNRPVLIKACRVQPRATPSDKSSAATRRVAERTREKERQNERERIRRFENVPKWLFSSRKFSTSGPTSVSQAVHHSVKPQHVNCATYCETDPSRAVWHLKPCGSFSIQSFAAAEDFSD